MKTAKNEAKEIMKAARDLGIKLSGYAAKDESVLPLLAAIKENSGEKSVVRYMFGRAVYRPYSDAQKEEALKIINEMNAFIREAVSKSENSKKAINMAMLEIIKNEESLGVLHSSPANTTPAAGADSVSGTESGSISEKINKFFDDDTIGTEAEWVNKNPNFEYVYGGCYLNKQTKLVEYLYHRRHDRLFHIGFVEHDKKNFEVYVDNRFIGTISKNWASFRPNGDSDSSFFLTGIQRSMERIAASEMEAEKRAAVGDPWFD